MVISDYLSLSKNLQKKMVKVFRGNNNEKTYMQVSIVTACSCKIATFVLNL